MVTNVLKCRMGVVVAPASPLESCSTTPARSYRSIRTSAPVRWLLGLALVFTVLSLTSTQALAQHVNGLSVTKTVAPNSAPQGTLVTVTITVENNDIDHGVKTIAVTNQAPFPGGPVTTINSCATTLAANDGVPGSGPDFFTCSFQERLPITCSATNSSVVDEVRVTGLDDAPGTDFDNLPVSGSASNSVTATPLVCPDDGNICNGPETCRPDTAETPGGCQSGPPLVCGDDGNLCNGPESCDPTLGCVSGPPLVCVDDGNVCNGPETCDPTAGCVSGPPLTCNDNDTCTDDSCDPVQGCQFVDNGTCAGQEGCTPGFWKANFDKKDANAWPVPTTTTLASVFTIPACLQDCRFAAPGFTLRDALSLQGGSSLCGKAEILLRAAAAAYLNSLNTCVAFPISTGLLIQEVNTALASCTKSTILTEATRLDGFNNLGCPINQQGQCTNQ